MIYLTTTKNIFLRINETLSAMWWWLIDEQWRILRRESIAIEGLEVVETVGCHVVFAGKINEFISYEAWDSSSKLT